MNFFSLLSILLINLFVFQSCDTCDKFTHEVYSPELYVKYLDSNYNQEIKPYLLKYDEPELQSLDYESYRLVYGHVFSDTSHLIRINKMYSGVNIIHKKLVMVNDTSYGVVQIDTHQMNNRAWEDVETAIYESNFWTMQREINRLGLDGGTTTLFGRRPQAQRCGKRIDHVVSRWSPEEGSPFDLLSNKIINLVR